MLPFARALFISARIYWSFRITFKAPAISAALKLIPFISIDFKLCFRIAFKALPFGIHLKSAPTQILQVNYSRRDCLCWPLENWLASGQANSGCVPPPPLYGPFMLLNLALQTPSPRGTVVAYIIFYVCCALLAVGWLLAAAWWLFLFLHSCISFGTVILLYEVEKWQSFGMHWLASWPADCRMPLIWLAAQHFQLVLLLLWAKLFSFASRTKPQPQPQTSRVFFFGGRGQVIACNAQ